MKHSSLLLRIMFSITGFLLVWHIASAIDDGGTADPVAGNSLWQVASRTFRKARANQSKLNNIESTVDSIAT